MCSSDETPVIDLLSAINGQQPATSEKPTTDESPTTDEKPAIDEKPATNEQTLTDGAQLADLRALGRKCRRLARLRRKEALLMQVRDMALEGHSCLEIGARLVLGKSTVHRWLQEMRRERRT